jgi:hypothetical protein
MDVPDNVRNGNGIRRGRLMSDGGDEKPVEEASKLRLTSSFRSRNVPPMIPPKPKVLPAPPTPTAIKRNPSFTNRLRSSFRNKSQATNWTALWETSLASKMGGGNLRVLDKKLLESYDKVNDSKSLHD